jgi:hypothetical protein
LTSSRHGAYLRHVATDDVGFVAAAGPFVFPTSDESVTTLPQRSLNVNPFATRCACTVTAMDGSAVQADLASDSLDSD